MPSRRLSNWHGAPDWTAYAQFNLGVALVRKDRLADAIPYLDRVGRIETRSEELLSLKDKANLALGFALLQAQARRRKPSPSCSACVSRVPTRARRCSASAGRMPESGEFKRALVPWLTLRKRSLLDSAVQESFLTVPYAYSQLSATGQAADYYNSAIESFDAEMQADRRLDRADPQRPFARPPAG